MARGRWVAVTTVLLLAVTVGADTYLTGLARSNLSSDGFPPPYQYAGAVAALPHDNITILSSGPGDQVHQLRGWWFTPPGIEPSTPGAAGGPAAPVAILVHGLGADGSKVVARWAPHLLQLGFHVVAFDLRNHGASTDAPAGYVGYGPDEARDVLAAVRFVREAAASYNADPQRVVLYGASMGAVAVLHAAAQAPPGVVAALADSGFATLRLQARIDGAADGYPAFLVEMVLQRMDREAVGQRVTDSDAAAAATRAAARGLPILLAHCHEDGRVDEASLPVLADAVRAGGMEPTVWHESCRFGLSTTQHVDGFATPGYNRTVAAFLGAYVVSADAQ